MEEVNKWWRPDKKEAFIKAMSEVLNDDMNAIIMTDEELFILANEKLDKEDKICYTSFKNYKSEWIKEENKELFNKFLSIYKRALLLQKANLFKSLKDETLWQKYAWIIERKFTQWNLKNISEVDQTVKSTVELNVSNLNDWDIDKWIKDLL